jgi:hypothetical protein
MEQGGRAVGAAWRDIRGRRRGWSKSSCGGPSRELVEEFISRRLRRRRRLQQTAQRRRTVDPDHPTMMFGTISSEADYTDTLTCQLDFFMLETNSSLSVGGGGVVVGKMASAKGRRRPNNNNSNSPLLQQQILCSHEVALHWTV